MRLALITDGIWPYVLGGMQKHSYYLCKYLAQNKIEVDLFHFNQSNYDIALLEFFSEDERSFIHATVIEFPHSVSFPGHYLYNSYRYSHSVFNALKDKLSTYDFIYCKGFSGWYLINQKYSGKIKCAPIGLKFHGYEMFQKSPDLKSQIQNYFLLRKPVRSISKKADVVFSYGGKITTIIKSIGVHENGVVELPSGVEETSLALAIRPTNDVIKFLFLGRYERRKGIEELNQAIQKLITHYKDKNFEFHFIGPIPSQKKLNDKHVLYHGEQRDKETLRRLIKNCDVLICPSWSEGLPNVILEAMASGLAVIATDVGATSILVNEQTGWLLNSSSPEEILSVIEMVLSLAPSVLDQKKQNALNLVSEDFTWEKLIHQLIDRMKYKNNNHLVGKLK